MPKSAGQKRKIFCLAKILYEETDEEHGLGMHDILSRLRSQGIECDRKTIYDDIEELRTAGWDILLVKEGCNSTYRLASRLFELAELKLLTDSVQAARFMTERKSNELIRKLERLTSKANAVSLQRQVVISGRVKTMNESIYYNVDLLHEAIGKDVKITFRYYSWSPEKKQELRHGGREYRVSPWALLWDNEYYYLVAFDDESGIMKHYRVDKMIRIGLTDEKREGKQSFDRTGLAQYVRGLFGMYAGPDASVTVECDNELIGAFIDRFGRDIPVTRVSPGRCRTTVRVSASRQFLGWIIGLGPGARIVGPESVVEDMRREISALSARYEPSEEA